MADLQIVDIGTTKTDSTIDADGDYLAADTTAGATYKALVDDFVIAALAQTASTVAIAADVNVDSGLLFVDVSENKIGIGTVTPDEIVVVSANQNDDTVLAIGNTSSGTAARAILRLTNGAAANVMVGGTGYTGLSSWQDSFIISTDSGLSGGVKIRAAAGGVRLSASGAEASDITINTSGFTGLGVASASVRLQVAGAIAVTDGMTAPSTVSGYAVIYVDSADGDLKIKFGDGTVKTIVTDT